MTGDCEWYLRGCVGGYSFPISVFLTLVGACIGEKVVESLSDLIPDLKARASDHKDEKPIN